MIIKICKECNNELLETDKIPGYDLYECSSCGYPNDNIYEEEGEIEMKNNIYFKISNGEKAAEVEQYLIENEIEYNMYTDPLKALCDEEVRRMREEYIQIELTDEQASELSEALFDTEMELLNYDTFLDITDRFVNSIELEE